MKRLILFFMAGTMAAGAQTKNVFLPLNPPPASGSVPIANGADGYAWGPQSGSGTGTLTLIATGAATGTTTGSGTLTLNLAGGAGIFTGTFTGQSTGTFTGIGTGTFNGVNLTTGGSSTQFLNGAGTYSTPATSGGTVTSLVAGTGLTFNPSGTITTTGTLSLSSGAAQANLTGGSGTLNLGGYTLGLVSGQIPNNGANTTGTASFATTAAGVGTGTYIPFLTGGVPAAATSNQIAAALSGTTSSLLDFSGLTTLKLPSSITTGTSGATMTTGGTVSNLTESPQQSVIVPQLALPLGPSVNPNTANVLVANVVFAGSSLTDGTGVAVTTNPVAGLYTGRAGSYPDYFQTSTFGRNCTVFNLGNSGDTISLINSKYDNGLVTTTAIVSNGSVTGTITGTTSGLSGTMTYGGAASTFPYAGTATVTGTIVTMSKAATATGTVTMVFDSNNTYGQTSFSTAGHLLSPAVTGVPGWFAIDSLGNDYYVNGVTMTGTATTGNASITGVSIQTSLSVGGATVAGVATYNCWSNGILLGTVSSASGTTVTLSSGTLVTSSMTTFKFCPLPTTNLATYKALVDKALADNYKVPLFLGYPLFYSAPGYNQQQYDENRLLYNSSLQSFYGNHAYSANVEIIDTANLQQLQASNSLFRSTSNYPHLWENGYQIVGNYVATWFGNTYGSYVATTWGNGQSAYTYPFQRYGLDKNWLPLQALRTDVSATVTTGVTYTGVALASTGNIAFATGSAITNLQTLNMVGGNNCAVIKANATNIFPGLILQNSSGTGVFALQYAGSTASTSFGAQDTVQELLSKDFYFQTAQNPVVNSAHITQSNGLWTFDKNVTVTGTTTLNGTLNDSTLTASTLIGTDGSKNLVSKTAGTDYSLISVQTGTLVAGTATKTVPSGCHPWAQDTNSGSLVNVGTLVVTVSGTTATITSTNVLDTSTFTLFNAGSQ